MMGDFADARREAERGLDLGRMIKAAGVIATTNLVLSAVNMYQDMGPESQQCAGRHTRNAIEVSTNADDAVFQYVSRGIQSWWLAMVGRFEEAAEEMGRCQALAAKLGGQLLYVDQFTARQADIALGLGRREQARAIVQQAVEISQKVGGVWAEAHACRAMARILATDSPPDFDGAAVQLARSLQLYESGQNLLGTAHAEIDWGGVCRLRGDEAAAREHYGKAIALFESKGIAKRAAQVRALIAG
jgi:tetratricopeptide (TPR) repeat protein